VAPFAINPIDRGESIDVSLHPELIESRDIRCQPCYSISDSFGINVPLKDPPNRNEMLRGPHAQEFIDAEHEEIINLYRMGMLEPTPMSDLLPDDTVLRTTWSYRYKMENGEIKRFRSRWCARGDQEAASDLATFSAMASSSCVRLLFALFGAGIFSSVSLKDVGNAFASAPARRRVFVSQPPGYWDGTDTVFRLRRAFGVAVMSRSRVDFAHEL